MTIKIDERKRELLIKYMIKKFDKIFSIDDNNRLMLIFFLISGLDLINKNDSDISDGKFGFTCHRSAIGRTEYKYDYSNLSLTYCALISLIILGDQLDRVNRNAIISGIRHHQQNDGRFIQSLIEEESDIRIVYCAVAVCYILQDWSSVNRDTIIAHIKSCQNYENAFGQTIGAEAHAGSTFCAIASLELMGQLNDVYDQRKRQLIAEWCLHRQVTGFQGRPHKDPDTCYSFWVGATLTMLNSFQFIDDQLHSEFLSTTFDYDGGGFGKYPDTSSDVLHTYFGLAALSLRVYNRINTEMDVQSIYPALNISQRAYKHLCSIHSEWNGGQS
ncbi:geranylgeranyl transferase type-1 subunit beta-like protein [Dermatophagoides farinae]|uniref:Geranylgeranyl transferase type-1 subunit beta-like protein n=1 Tax=Dermatophagoides farinae TaxID=6954 RepID=A0A9D4NRA2_DERFA|nr:geranylgeranyl transferase type-1 subunit beta-like protein [Dermatophagoides farinae]